VDAAIHINTALTHQVEHGEWFRSGFKRHAITATVTSDRTMQADVHVISGNWYALRQWIGHPRVIALDRDHYRGNPDNVSLGWLRPDGGREFRIGAGRPAPVPLPRKIQTASIFLADYNGPIDYDADELRLHPSTAGPPQRPLLDALKPYGVAIGYRTTALVTAALAGLRVICRDKRGMMARPDWLEVLPYADWHKSEISSGDAWEHLRG